MRLYRWLPELERARDSLHAMEADGASGAAAVRRRERGARGAQGAAAAPEVFALSSLDTVRPRGTPRGRKAAQLEAARGEWESFQVVVRAGPRALSG